MSKENPYLSIYQSNVPDLNKSLNKQNLYKFAINLGQVHNLLGLMISQIVKVMGLLPLDEKMQVQEFRNNQNIAPQQTHSQYQQLIKNRCTTISPSNQNRIDSKFISKQYILQKMQVQGIDSKEIKRKSFQISGNFNLSEFELDISKMNKQKNGHQVNKKSIFSQLLIQTQKKLFQTQKKLFQTQKKLFQTQKKSQIKQQVSKNQSEDMQVDSQRTQTAQIVRYDQRQKKLAASLSFDQLNKFGINLKDQQQQQKIQILNKRQKQQKVPKFKSPFFDLFDSSQTNSNQIFEDNRPQDVPHESQNNLQIKYYPQTQHSDQRRNDFGKQDLALYSPQIKNNTAVKLGKKVLHKKTNLLQDTYWVNSPHQSMFNVQEQVYQLQTSNKKAPFRSEGKKQSVKQSVNYDEYIPRREQRGRKKSDRQGLKGSECPDCKAFYEAVNAGQNNFSNICECTSRHKSSTTFMGKPKLQNYSQTFNLD